MIEIRIPFQDQKFETFEQWVSKANRWLTRHPDFNNTEHGDTKGWRGHHFTALCFDMKGRRVRQGGDFQRAKEEGAFPVWWIWPDQIVELVSLYHHEPDRAALGESYDEKGELV